MGIKPDGDVNLTAPSSTPQERFQDMANDLENVGEKAGEAWGEMYTEAESAKAGSTELAVDLTALESQPLMLWWDGTGTRPVLKPGWALLNTSNGTIEKD